MDGNSFQSIIKKLPVELREAFEEAFSEFPINVIKSFIEQYESDSPYDQLISRVAACIIVSISNGLEEDVKKTLEGANPQYSRKQAGAVAVRKLREIAEQIESQLDGDECGECCKHKH